MRHGARGERDAHRAHRGVHLLGNGQDGVQVSTRRAGGAPAIFSIRTVPAMPRRPAVQVESSDRDVVVDHDRLDVDAFHLGHLSGGLEVQHVIGVVLHDVQDARAAVHSLGGFEDGVRVGDVKTAPGTQVEHACPRPAAVVAGAASETRPTCPAPRVRTNHVVRVEMNGDEVSVCSLEACHGSRPRHWPDR